MDERNPLALLVSSTRTAVEERERERPLEVVRAEAQARAGSRGFRDALRGPGVAVIAEFKRASPTSGRLGHSPDLAATLQSYENAGASAVSVLTEPTKFEGSQADLRLAERSCSLPILCKDFIIRDYQIFEARACGADAILLIACILEPEKLRGFRALAISLGLDVLVEVRDGGELDTVLDLRPDLVGINNRDLTKQFVDLSATRELAGRIPDGVVKVSESGLKNPEAMAQIAALGIDAGLVGTALMDAEDPEATCRALVEATQGAHSTAAAA